MTQLQTTINYEEMGEGGSHFKLGKAILGGWEERWLLNLRSASLGISKSEQLPPPRDARTERAALAGSRNWSCTTEMSEAVDSGPSCSTALGVVQACGLFLTL